MPRSEPTCLAALVLYFLKSPTQFPYRTETTSLVVHSSVRQALSLVDPPSPPGTLIILFKKSIAPPRQHG